MEYEEDKKRTIKIVIISVSILLAIVLMLILNPFVIVGAGYRGVVLNWGAVSDKVLNEGIHFRVPVMQKVIKMEVRTVKMEVPVIAYSKDIQTVDSLIALNYQLDSQRVNTLYQTLGLEFESRIISPTVQEAVKSTTAKFTAQDLIEKREQVRDEIKASLTERLAEDYIIVNGFSLVNFDFSSEYEKAIEAKQVAQQNALKAENDLKRIETEAKQRVAQAEAEARAIQIQAEAITQQGGKEYVNLKAVEKWNGILPEQMIPNGALPFINLDK